MKVRFLWACFALIWLEVFATAAWSQPSVAPEVADAYKRLAGAVSSERIRQTVYQLSSYPSRVAGYPGSEEAAKWIEEQFRQIGLQRVTTEEFAVTVPVDKGAKLRVGNREFPLYAMWPNLVRTSQLPPEGVTGPVIYARDGKLPNFSGKNVEGSIVLVDFNCGTDWLNAPRLGAKAVIFIEPNATMRGEAESKFIGIPVTVPRFYIRKSDAAPLLALTAEQREVKGTLFCNMPWERRTTRNIIGWIEGTDPKFKNQIIVISAYYDAMSAVPALAPGAESACGLAGLLEVARAYKANPPKRTILFIATSAHFLSLQGVREWMDRHMFELERPNVGQRLVNSLISTVGIKPKQKKLLDIYLFLSLDLSSKSRQVGLFYKGYFYDMREDVQNRFSDTARICRENAEKVGYVLGFDHKKAFADGVNPVEGKNWRNYLPGKFAFDAEVVTLSGANGMTFCTTDDSRALVDTPFDTPEKVNIANVTRQTKLIACLLYHILNDTNAPGELNVPRFPISEPGNFQTMGLQGGFGTLDGQVVLFDPRKSFIPNQPVPGSLAVVRHATKTFMGVRGNMIQKVGDDAYFRFPGIPPITAYGWNRMTSVAAYRLNEQTGEIEFAPDLGVTGASEYAIDFTMSTGRKTTRIVVFRCVPTSIYDLVDQQALRALNTMEVLDGETNGQPRMYGYTLATVQDYSLTSYVEDVAVVFAQPGSRIKIMMGVGPGATRFLLINSTPQKPEGEGYLVAGSAEEAQGFVVRTFSERELTERDLIARGGTIANTALRVAEDMWNLDEWRMSRLRQFRIINEGLEQLHGLAKEHLDKARAALERRDYATFDAYARAAWGYEARAYPDVQATANDVVRGVIFYMFLLMPFAYFMERLLFGFSDLKRQLLTAFIIFLLVFFAFSQIHPAFQLVSNLFVVLLAFIMLALSLLVTFMVAGKFEEQLKQLNRQISGIHRADIGRVSVAFAAFNLGVSNMRRRKARTLLTSITLVLLTFIVLSFTSIVNVLRFNKVPAPGTPLYNGIMIRTALWEPLQEPAYRLLQDEFRDRAVAPRSWFFGAAFGEQSFLTLRRGDRQYDAKAAVGLSPAEAEVTQPQKALVAGRWFREGDRYVAIVPTAIAQQLRIEPADVGKAKVNFSGVDYTVIGILDSQKFKQITDLDREPLTPVDFILMQKMQRQGAGAGEAGFREYVHLEPDACFYIPYKTLMNIGGEIRSIAISFATPDEVRVVLDKLMPRLGLNIYAGQGDRTWRYSTLAATSGRGIEFVVIPVLIAALIVLQTMLSSVYERVKEIHIFSSLGLSPTHIGLLFLAEAMVYAILGSVTGYFLGQLSAKIIVWLNVPGLYLNFSSMAAVVSTLIVVATVLGSTIYPARKASEVATPALERTWRVPEPEGDVWRIPMPFSVTRVQAAGLNSFLSEWLQAYEEYSIGDFVTQGVKAEEYEHDGGTAYRITCTAWVAPFDLGVSQNVEIEATPTDMPDVYDLHLTLTRLSGDIANWKRVNRRFLNTLRKQFLIWRTLRQEERERYLQKTDGRQAAGVPSTQPATGA